MSHESFTPQHRTIGRAAAWDEKPLLEVPLTASVAVGMLTMLAPVIAALGAFTALIAHVKVEIVRQTDDTKS